MMSKNIYLIVSACLIFLCSSQNTSAQTYPFPSPGLVQTEVYHLDWTQQMQVRNNSFQHMGDTVVNGYTYSRFAWLPVGSSNYWYTWYNNGKVYWQANSTPSVPSTGAMMYDFTLTVGNTFFIASNNFYGTFTVDLDTTITLPNSQVRKYLRMVNGTDTVRWIDGIGDITRGFFYSDDFEGGYEELVCIKDSLGPLYSVDNSPFYCNELDPTPNSGPNTCDLFSCTTNIFGTSCIGCDGYVSVTNVSGGTAPYTYTWSNGGTGSYQNSLCQGPITVTIHDVNGDSCARTYFVGESTINLNFSSPDLNHCDGIDTFCIAPGGGSAPYVFQWSTGTNASCDVIYAPGTYTITATDGNGCTATHVFTVGGGVITNNTQPTGASCVGCCDGNVNLSFNGGTAPYTVTYPNGPWPAANNFCMGWYSYCVTDAFDCGYCDSIFVMEPLSVQENSHASFSVFPNPANDEIRLRISQPGKNTVVITDLNGRVIIAEETTEQNPLIDVSDLSEGIYFIRVGNTIERLTVVHP
jgi:hypothetical protein